MNANEPAFPEPFINDPNLALSVKGGLTKREYFAAMAMQGILGSCDGNVQGMEPNEENIIYMVRLSVKATDELLKQLEP
jgi:hypothetical protein